MRSELDERRHRKLRFAVEEAHLHASPDEALIIDRLVDAVRLGQLTPQDATARVADIRRAQRDRATHAA